MSKSRSQKSDPAKAAVVSTPTDKTEEVYSAGETETLQPGRMWAPGEVIADLYRIEEVIAMGGMGVVYKAYDLATHQFVVIKSLLPKIAGNRAYSRRFVREAEEWVSLGKHPNIVRAYTVHEFDYLPNIVAEFVDGEGFEVTLHRRDLSLQTALNYAGQICWGMDFAHKHDIAHLDLKPGNILKSGDGVLKITDFGLVRRHSEEKEREAAQVEYEEPTGKHETLGVLGTPEYLAPEQWDGKGTRLSDIYSFGVILYEMICGMRPFDFGDMKDADQVKAYKKAHREEKPRAPYSMEHDIPPALESLSMKCLEKLESRRPQTFREIAEAINAIAEKRFGAPAAPEPPPEVLDRQAQLDQAYGLLRLGMGCHTRGDWDKAQKLIEQSRDAFREQGDMGGMVKVQQLLGKIHYMRGEYNDALKQYQKSLDTAGVLNDKQALCHSYNLMGVLLRRRGQLRESEEYHVKSLNLARELNDRLALSMAFNNLGVLRREQGETDAALGEFEKSRAILAEIDHKPGIAACYNNMGNIAFTADRFDEALTLYEKCLDIVEMLSDKSAISNCYNNIGTVHRARGKPDEALEMFEMCRDVKERLGDKDGLGSCYENLGELYNAQRRRDKALDMYEKAVRIYRALKNDYRLGGAAYAMARTQADDGDLRDAIRTLTQALAPLEAAAHPDLAAARKLLNGWKNTLKARTRARL